MSRNRRVLSGGTVTAQGVPNMSVAVAAGTILGDGAIASITATNPLAIAAADPASPRIDIVCVPVAGGVPVVISGNPASVPKPPALPDDRLLLAYVSVAAAAANIQSSNITDRRLVLPHQITADTLANRPSAAIGGLGLPYFATNDAGGTLYRSTGAAWVAVASGVAATKHSDAGAWTGAVTVDFANANYIEGETSGNVTGFTLTNLPTGVPVYLLVKYGGAHTIAFTTAVKWTSQTTPTFTSLVGRYDMIVLVKNIDGDIIASADLGH